VRREVFIGVVELFAVVLALSDGEPVLEPETLLEVGAQLEQVLRARSLGGDAVEGVADHVVEG
jgi:hypothetical protein